VTLTAKYLGLEFHGIDGPLNGFSEAAKGSTEDYGCVLWKLNEDASEKLVKGCGCQ
jgi:hypothetical protein